MRSYQDHICSVALAGGSHEHRRHLFKTLLESAWLFANWLTHTKPSHWHDAEAAVATSENAVSLCTSAVIRHIRGVPDQMPCMRITAIVTGAWVSPRPSRRRVGATDLRQVRLGG